MFYILLVILSFTGRIVCDLCPLQAKESGLQTLVMLDDQGGSFIRRLLSSFCERAAFKLLFILSVELITECT